MKIVLVLIAVLALAGCDEIDSVPMRYANNLNQTYGYQNARDVGRGYVMYEIEGGAVTCREHSRRSELTCWKN